MDEGVQENFSKIPAVCAVFDECGGCQYQDIAYSDELKLKERYLQELLKQKLGLSSEIFQPILASPQEYHYRNRLDLKLIQTKSKEVFIGFSPKSKHRLIPVETCPIARGEINQHMALVKEQAKCKVTDKHRQANLVVRTGDDGRVFWGGIGRRSLELQPQDYLWTEIAGRRIFYSLDTFFQANLYILPLVMERLRALNIWEKPSVFFDLYGGVGLFGLCVHDWVNKVVLIEEVPASLKVARHNVNYHQLSSFDIKDGRVEEVLPGLLETMSAMNNIVMVDPPRAGLSHLSIELLNRIAHVKHLIYLSCNPESLADNCLSLQEHWQIKSVLPLDFFPRTRHLETLVVFHKKEK